MNTYSYTVNLTVEIDAFSEEDAWDALQDIFGIGDFEGTTVTECEFEIR